MRLPITGYSLIVTLGVSYTVFEILAFKARKWLVLPPLAWGIPLEFLDETYTTKTRWMRLPHVKIS